MDFREAVLPQFFPAAWLDNTPEIVFSDFPSRIRVGYVVREDGAYSYLLKQQFLASGLTIEAVHASALDNLQKLPSAQIRIASVGGAAEGFISAEDNFAAVRLLLPAVRLEFASQLGDEFLATLPNRDQCFCWSQAQDGDRQLRHAAEAVEDFNSDYNLTPDILLVNTTTFRLFREQDTENVIAQTKLNEDGARRRTSGWSELAIERSLTVVAWASCSSAALRQIACNSRNSGCVITK